MKQLSLLLTAGAFLLTSAVNAATTQQKPSDREQLEQTKLAVIKELAESGVEEAFLILAKMSARRVVANPLPDEELIHWYTLAGQHGRSEAMLWLGHYFLHGKGRQAGRQNHALKLLASSAILGNVQATNDLVLIPKIMSVDYTQIDRAFRDAIAQLKSGQLIDCSWLNCNDEHPLTSARAITDAKTQSIAFESNWRDANLASYYPHIKRIGQQHITASIEDTSMLAAKYKHLNTGKIKKLKRITREQREQKNPDWKLRTYLDRIASRRQGAKDALERYQSQDLLTLKDDIRRILKLINTHRDPSAQISVEDVLKKTGMTP